MTYIVQNPESRTNPTDKYRIVQFREWLQSITDPTTTLPVYGVADSREAAEAIRDHFNNPMEAQ